MSRLSYQEVVEFYGTPVPRIIPEGYYYRDLFARLFIVLGGIFVTLSIGMCILFSVLIHFGLLASRSGGEYSPAHSGVVFIPIIFSLPAVGLLWFGLARKKRVGRLLSEGHLVEAVVKKVQPLPVRYNQMIFFRVSVEVNMGVGRPVMATDMIDDFAVDYFVDARDEGRVVDILYLENSPDRVFLLHKIISSNKYD